MTDPATYRPAPRSIPDQPGVYRFLDPRGRVIYVGKARSLRSRLNSYFADLSALHARTQAMVTTAAAVEWTTVSTEVEALQLEYAWIKEFDPRFNVKYRDDKSYPVLAVTTGEQFPRIVVMRGPRRKGVRYFGPYAHAWAIRETVDTLLRVFPIRTCSGGVFARAARTGRPCLLGYIDKCSAPCVGRVSPDEHRAIVDDFCSFMAGNTDKFVRDVEKKMRAAAADLDFEAAARLRDDAGALKRSLERNAVVFGDGTDADVVGIAQDELEAAVYVFHVRSGRVRGQRGWVTEKVEDVDTGALLEHLLQALYGDLQPQPTASRDPSDSTGRRDPTRIVDVDPAREAVPREILLPSMPTDAATVTEWLSSIRGTRVELKVPQRGDKRALLDTVTRNAEQSLALHKTRRAGDLTSRGRALEELREALDLDQVPLRIECVDVSHIQGSEVVASLVVFEDGSARKSEYRRFTIRPQLSAAANSGDAANSGSAGDSGSGGDPGSAADSEDVARYSAGSHSAAGPGSDVGGDVGSITQVVQRRFRRYLEETGGSGRPELGGDPDAPDITPAAAVSAGAPALSRGTRPDGSPELAVRTGIDPVTGKPQRFAYPPQLLVIDGGRPQVDAAQRVLDELGIDDVAVIGLAKRLEEVFLPYDPDPVILPRSSEALYLLQRIRDEAHRFAITHHRQRRSKAMIASALDEVPGVGPARRAALLRHFGSVKRLAAATVDELADVPGMGPATASAVLAALAEQAAAKPSSIRGGQK